MINKCLLLTETLHILAPSRSRPNPDPDKCIARDDVNVLSISMHATVMSICKPIERPEVHTHSANTATACACA